MSRVSKFAVNNIRPFVTARECGVVIFSVASVCVSVCPVWALTFDSLDLHFRFDVRARLYKI